MYCCSPVNLYWRIMTVDASQERLYCMTIVRTVLQWFLPLRQRASCVDPRLHAGLQVSMYSNDCIIYALLCGIDCDDATIALFYSLTSSWLWCNCDGFEMIDDMIDVASYSRCWVIITQLMRLFHRYLLKFGLRADYRMLFDQVLIVCVDIRLW